MRGEVVRVLYIGTVEQQMVSLKKGSFRGIEKIEARKFRRRAFFRSGISMEDQATFDPDLVHAIFKLIWNRRTQERERNEGIEILDNEKDQSDLEKIGVYRNLARTGVSKKDRPTTANANALKLSCELLRLFIAEAVQRAATISDAECVNKIEATHLERILPQLLLDF